MLDKLEEGPWLAGLGVVSELSLHMNQPLLQIPHPNSYLNLDFPFLTLPQFQTVQ